MSNRNSNRVNIYMMFIERIALLRAWEWGGGGGSTDWSLRPTRTSYLTRVEQRRSGHLSELSCRGAHQFAWKSPTEESKSWNSNCFLCSERLWCTYCTVHMRVCVCVPKKAAITHYASLFKMTKTCKYMSCLFKYRMLAINLNELSL